MILFLNWRDVSLFSSLDDLFAKSSIQLWHELTRIVTHFFLSQTIQETLPDTERVQYCLVFKTELTLEMPPLQDQLSQNFIIIFATFWSMFL